MCQGSWDFSCDTVAFFKLHTCVWLVEANYILCFIFKLGSRYVAEKKFKLCRNSRTNCAGKNVDCVVKCAGFPWSLTSLLLTFSWCDCASRCLSILNFLVWSITTLQEEQNKIPSHACKVPLKYWRTLSAADILTAVWLSFSFFFKNLSMIAEKEFILHVLFNFYNSWSYLLWQKPIKTTVIKSREPG